MQMTVIYSEFRVNENTTELGHKRLGHYHHQWLLQMKTKALVSGLPKLDDQFPHCKACQIGKQIRKSFQSYQKAPACAY